MSDSDSDSVSKRTGKRKRSKEEEQEHDRTKLARIKDQWETKEAKAQLQFVIDQSNLEIAPFQCASVMLGLCHFCGAHLINEHYRESIMLFDFNDDPTIVFCKFKPRCYFSALRSKSLYYERSKCLPVQISSRDFVRVKRTSGALETDWKILALQEIILENKPVLAARVRNSSMVTKCVPLEEFFTLNPNWHYHGQWFPEESDDESKDEKEINPKEPKEPEGGIVLDDSVLFYGNERAPYVKMNDDFKERMRTAWEQVRDKKQQELDSMVRRRSRSVDLKKDANGEALSAAIVAPEKTVNVAAEKTQIQ